MIYCSDVFTYADLPKTSRKASVMVLSIDQKFKEKVIEENCKNVLVGFKENSIDEVEDFASYFKFFMKVLPEVSKVIIDETFYSPAVALIHSAALNMDNIKDIILYADTKELSFFAKDPTLPSTLTNKEKTYSRQQFLNS